MLEFYYKYQTNIFHKKARQLAQELIAVLSYEKIIIEEATSLSIPAEYKEFLKKDLFNLLNNIYFTIRKNGGATHPLLKKYLPELKKKPVRAPLFADFFSGAGGLSQGMINAGFTPAFVNDNYISALETYYFNHSLPLSNFFNGDIRKLVEEFPKYKAFFKDVKVVTGGPPCQGFSTANRQNFEIVKKTGTKRFIEDERNILYKYFVKLIGLIKPDFFIMENVRGMKKVEDQIEEDIQNETNSEYYFFPLVIDAQTFDVPQSRTRYLLIGSRNFLLMEQIRDSLEQKKKKKGSVFKLKDALYGLPPIGTNPFKLNTDYEGDAHGFNIRKIKVRQNKFLKAINNGSETEYLFNHKSRYNNENDLEIFRLLPEGENSLHDSISHLNKYKNRDHIFSDKYYKLNRDDVSKTITSHMKYDCHMYIHPEQARGLSPREAARIQTFPDDYMFRGSLNDWYKQIGNAVPVKLAENIAKEIMNYYI